MGKFAAHLGGAILAGSLATATAQAALIYAVDNGPGQQIVSFDSATPRTLNSARHITGLQPNEQIVAIDFRGGTLYGVGSNSLLYTLNTSTGAASLAGPLFQVLDGTEFGLTHLPTDDTFRLVSDLDQNLAIAPTGGSVELFDLAYFPIDPSAGRDPNVVALATGSPQISFLYGVDSNQNTLVRVDPTSGLLSTIGPLAADASALAGFDVEGPLSFAAMNTPGDLTSMLYTINLSTGEATPVGNIGNNDGTMFIRDIALVPEPATASVLGLAFAGMLLRRRR